MRLHEIGDAGISGDEVVLDVRPTRIFDLTRGRNAWHSTWVRHYFPGSDIFSTVESAKDEAELRRERGNVFDVTDYPALYVRTTEGALVVVDRHGGVEPFQRWNDDRALRFGVGIAPGVPARALVQGLTEFEFGCWKDWRQRDEMHVAICRVPGDSDVRPLGSRSFLRRTSHSDGPNYYLWYSTVEVPSVNVQAVKRVARRFVSRDQRRGDAYARVLAEIGRQRSARRSFADLAASYGTLAALLERS